MGSPSVIPHIARNPAGSHPLGHRPPSPWPGKTWRKPFQVPPVPWLPTLRGPSSSSSSSRFPPQPCLDFPAANQLCHPKAGSESWKAGLVQPSSGSWPCDSPRPPKTLLPAFGMQETPKTRGKSNGIVRRVFISPTGIWEKPRMGLPGCSSTFLRGLTSGVHRCATAWWGGCWC